MTTIPPPAGSQGDVEKVMSLAGVRELVDEIESLRVKLQPSPCGVGGHRMADWDSTSLATNGVIVTKPFPRHCLACQRERAEMEMKMPDTSVKGTQELKACLLDARHKQIYEAYTAGQDPIRLFDQCDIDLLIPFIHAERAAAFADAEAKAYLRCAAWMKELETNDCRGYEAPFSEWAEAAARKL